MVTHYKRNSNVMTSRKRNCYDVTGEEGRWEERQVHDAVHAQLPAAAVPGGGEAGQAAGPPHADQAGHHTGAVAVHQEQEVAGGNLLLCEIG